MWLRRTEKRKAALGSSTAPHLAKKHFLFHLQDLGAISTTGDRAEVNVRRIAFVLGFCLQVRLLFPIATHPNPSPGRDRFWRRL
jgi:hypothetical protein